MCSFWVLEKGSTARAFYAKLYLYLPCVKVNAMSINDAKMRILLLVIRQACLQVARGIEEALSLPKRTMIVELRPASGKGAAALSAMPIEEYVGETAFGIER
jgi:hypothetical protein